MKRVFFDEYGDARRWMSGLLLFVGLGALAVGLFFCWQEVYHNPTKAEIQEALKKGEKVPRMHIYHFNQPRLIEGFAFEEFKLGPNGEIEKQPSVGFCES